MVVGTRVTERGDISLRSSGSEIVTYRELPSLNCSAIKVFEKKGLNAFYKEFILKEVPRNKQEMEESYAIIVGCVFDFLMTDCKGDLEAFDQRYDERFILFNGIKSERQEFLLADEIFNLYKSHYINEEGVLTQDFRRVFEEALENMKTKDKFKGKTMEKALELFMTNPSEEKLRENPNLTSAYQYFQRKMESINKQVVDIYHLQTAKRLHQQALTDNFVGSIFWPDGQVINKLVLEWTQVTANGHLECKAELDKTIWDAYTKHVRVVDIKTIYSNRKELIKANYYKLLYSWQAAYYLIGMRHYLESIGKGDWTCSFEFCFFSTGDLARPVVLEYTAAMEHEALYGYPDAYKYNRGLLEVLDRIAWHQANGIWNVEYDVLISNGKVNW